MDCASLRDEFPVTKSAVFFNNASVSPLPARTAAVVSELAKGRCASASADFPRWMQDVEETHRLAAKLVGASSPSEIAFTANTSHSLSFMAAGLDLGAGDAVSVTSPDFPSVLFPWLNLERQGVEVRRIERKNGRFTPEDVERTLDDKTRVVCIGAVDWVTGFMADIAEIGRLCKDRGVFFCVDAIQSLGVTPMDVESMCIDMLAAGSHKWLLAPQGVGLLYISQRARERVRPSVAGWRSMNDEEDFKLEFNLKPDARAFEAGTMNLSGILGLKSSLEMILDLGAPAIRQRVHSLGGQLIHGLRERSIEPVTPEDPGHRAGIVSFKAPGGAVMLHRYLGDQNVVCSLRDGNIRLSPHFYNNAQDVEAFFKILDQML
ncbi:MAG: aminotransferase class V-fold PLP-dependent enzyme [Desulfovibrionaceae bacterium]